MLKEAAKTRSKAEGRRAGGRMTETDSIPRLELELSFVLCVTLCFIVSSLESIVRRYNLSIDYLWVFLVD